MATIQFWKLPFRKSGYPAETYEVSTVGKVVGDYIVFPRKYFQIAGTSALYLDKKDSTYKPASLGTDPTMFLVAKNIDAELTDSLGINIYTRLQLKSAKVVNTNLKLVYQPFGDVLDPQDFQQSLTPTSDVTFKSVTITHDLTCRNVTLTNNLTLDKITANLGIITEVHSDLIKAKELIVGTGDNKFSFKNGMLEINGKTYPQVDPDTLIYTNTLKVLTLSPANFVELLPIDWLTVDVTKHDLAIQGTNILETINELKERIRILEGKI